MCCWLRRLGFVLVIGKRVESVGEAILDVDLEVWLEAFRGHRLTDGDTLRLPSVTAIADVAGEIVAALHIAVVEAVRYLHAVVEAVPL